jgi:hypothetical protein
MGVQTMNKQSGNKATITNTIDSTGKDDLNDQDLEKVSGGTTAAPKGTSNDESTKEEVTFEYGGLQLR